MRDLNLPAANKPLFFLDTDKGSDWVARKIKDAGVELYTAKTCAFADLARPCSPIIATCTCLV